METTGKRLENLDALRSVAMLLIILWHFGYNTLDGLSMTGCGLLNFFCIDAAMLFAALGVNVFVLISGYFLVQKAFNLQRILRLWLEVLFYSVLFSALGWILGKEPLNARSVFVALFPVLNNRYWFIAPYLGMVLLAPFLSKTALALTQKQYQWLLVVLVCICCTFTLGFPYGNIMGAGNGYSLLWFICLFFWGGFLRRFDPFPGRKKLRIVFILAALLVYLFYIGKGLWRWKAGENVLPEFSANNSFAFPLAVLLFLLFLKKTPPYRPFTRALASLAPCTFGIYLIHDHPVVRQLLWEDGWARTGIDSGSPWLIPAMLLACCLIFLICAGMDGCRQWVRKQIRTEALLDRLSRKIYPENTL